ncbi:LysR family transcriptional regulator [Shewanella woodyi]|uniref:LysR family transcriptional regulator n=1 Tax=Shewanella woodyi TaxID=60961 RepID=UPI00059CDC82|nr:LysR family transcriptional regulator [Shewanella woodyi]
MNLEDSLGVVLFERYKTGVIPTPFCNSIIEQCQQVLYELDDIKHNANIYRGLEEGELKIGVGRASTGLICQNILPKFVAAYPKVQVSIIEGTPEELTLRLQQREFDFIIAGFGSYANVEQIKVSRLKSISLSIIVNNEHPVNKLPTVTWQDLLPYPIIGATKLSTSNPLYKLFEKLTNKTPSLPSVMCSDYQALKNIVLSSNAWLIAPTPIFEREIKEKQLTRIELSVKEMEIDLSVIELSKRQRSPMSEKFISLCEGFFCNENHNEVNN